MADIEILIEGAPGQIRIARVEDGRLVELHLERPDRASVVGNIYLGRVQRTLPGIQAAFVDIGLERAGFLSLADARPAGAASRDAADRIADYAGEGDAIIVQAASDPPPAKGAKLTARVTLAGRHLVLTPGQPGVRVSRRLDDDPAVAARLRTVESLAIGPDGFILRTTAARARDDELRVEAERLGDRWRDIQAAAKTSTPPACLHREDDALRRVLRDAAGDGVARIVVEDSAALAATRAALRDAAPDLAARLVAHPGSGLFAGRGIEEQIDRALAVGVPLPSGGNLTIQETTALVAIDVNSGGHTEGGPEDTARRVNLEAAAEIARQLRLRNLGGLVVVDFVAMRRRESRDAILDALRAAVATDRCPTFVGGYTRMGLVELTRERRQSSLAAALAADCAACDGSGRRRAPETVALDGLRAVVGAAAADPATRPALALPPAAAAALDGSLAAARAEAGCRLGHPLRVIVDERLAADRFAVVSDPGPGAGGDDRG